MTNTEVYGL